MGLGPDFIQGNTQAFQDARGDAFTFTEQADEKVFGPDISVVHSARLIDGQFHHLLSSRGEPNLTLGRLLASANNKLDCGADLTQVNSQAGEDSCGHALRFSDKAKEDVLGADVVVVEALGLFLGK